MKFSLAFAIITILFFIISSSAFGKSCSPQDTTIIIPNEFYEKKNDRRTVWSFDLSKSKLTDFHKTLYAQMPSQYTWLGVNLDFTFFLAKCNTLGNDKQARRGYVTVDGTNTIPMSLGCGMASNGTCKSTELGGSIHSLVSDLYPAHSNRPVGVEIKFPSETQIYSPKTQRYHDIEARLRLMCATQVISEFQKIPLNFVDNPQMSWIGEKLIITFNYWTAAGCGELIPDMPRGLNAIEIFALIMAVMVIPISFIFFTCAMCASMIFGTLMVFVVIGVFVGFIAFAATGGALGTAYFVTPSKPLNFKKKVNPEAHQRLEPEDTGSVPIDNVTPDFNSKEAEDMETPIDN